MSIKITGDTDEPHGISWRRVFANVTFFSMLGLGFMYQQATEIVEATSPKISQQVRIDQPAETVALTEESDEKADEKGEIAEAISAYRSSLNEDDIAVLVKIIRKESKRYDYDWQLILAIIRTESHFDVRARSHKGARGLMQVLPSTAKWLSPKLGLEYKGRDSLYDPEYNIKLGTHYLYILHQRYGNIEKAIVAYNRGPDGLARYLRQGREFPPEYLVKVMGYYKDLKDSSSERAS